MQFEFKQQKVIPGVVANVNIAQDDGKCPYCGTGAGNAATCPKCSAPLGGSGGGGGAAPSGGGGDGGYCSNCGQQYPAGAKFCNGCGNKV